MSSRIVVTFEKQVEMVSIVQDFGCHYDEIDMVGLHSLEDLDKLIYDLQRVRLQWKKEYGLDDNT